MGDMLKKDQWLERAWVSPHGAKTPFDSRLTISPTEEYGGVCLVHNDGTIDEIFDYWHYKMDPCYVLLRTKTNKLFVGHFEQCSSHVFTKFFIEQSITTT